MKTIMGAAALAVLIVLPACQSGRAQWDNASAAASTKLEVQMNEKGRMQEIEYHIAPTQVPQAVRDAMDRLHPGGRFDDAEKEWNEGRLYYELSRKVKGMDVEAMFTPDGELHSEEIQVPMTSVPAPVRDAAMASLGTGARPDKWEEIRDGSRTIVEYHVKMSRGNDKFKVILSTEGMLLAIYRALRPNGVFLMQDISASSDVAKNADHPLGTLLYTISCMHCMTVSLACDGHGLGAMWGREKACEMLAEAGFKRIRIHDLPHDPQNCYYVVQK